MELKLDLDNVYQIWQEQINNSEVHFGNILSALGQKIRFERIMKKHRWNLETIELITDDEKVKQELKQIIEELDMFKVQLNEKHQNFDASYSDFRDRDHYGQRGLLPQRIQKFEQFTADESFVSDQCVICMEDFEIGRNMMRVDCDGQHTFCKVCIEKWFTEHKTCPVCRHEF